MWKFWAAYAVKYFIVDYEFVAKKDYDITWVINFKGGMVCNYFIKGTVAILCE